MQLAAFVSASNGMPWRTQRPGVRWHAAFHSALVICVSLSHLARHDFSGTPLSRGRGTAARPATVDTWTMAEGQADTDTSFGAGCAGPGWEGGVTGAGAETGGAEPSTA